MDDIKGAVVKDKIQRIADVLVKADRLKEKQLKERMETLKTS